MMKNWINKHFKTIITSAFLIPIITVAIVSISHVTKWYGISNPMSWSLYLSIGIEIAALSSLAAISVNMGKKIYLPFGIVTFVQFIGNVYFAYLFIDLNGESFKSWVQLISPIGDLIGIEENDLVSHKRFLALFSGGLLPLISLSFLHMLVKFTEEDRKNIQDDNEVIKEEPFNNHFCPTTTGYCNKKECDMGRSCVRKTTNESIDEKPLFLSDDTLKKIETILERKNELINNTEDKIFKDLPVDKIIEYNGDFLDKVICPVTNDVCTTCKLNTECSLQTNINNFETNTLYNEDNICPVTKLQCDDETCPIGASCNLQGNEIKDNNSLDDLPIEVSNRISLTNEKKKDNANKSNIRFSRI